MLPYEIEPFANAHIEALDSLKLELDKLFDPTYNPSAEEIRGWKQAVETATQGYVRFRVCMVDEVQQKKKLRDKLREIRKSEKS